LNVPMLDDENTPSALIVPPLAAHETGISAASRLDVRARPLNCTRWPAPIVTDRGRVRRATELSSELGDPPSGEVRSPAHARTSARVASITKCRRIASLRASLNVYVIAYDLSDSPFGGAQPCPTIPRHSEGPARGTAAAMALRQRGFLTHRAEQLAT
jgi:hypothetical protein